jgi:hypothetical protein
LTQELTYQVFGRGVDVRRERQVSDQDLFVDAERVLVVKGWVSDEHFVGQDSEGPPVDSFAVAIGFDDFGGEVFWGSADGPSTIGTSFRETKVDDFDVSQMV